MVLLEEDVERPYVGEVLGEVDHRNYCLELDFADADSDTATEGSDCSVVVATHNRE